MKKQRKVFDVYCDSCGEVTDNYDTFNEWQEHEEDTISLTVCKQCQGMERYRQYKRWKNKREEELRKEVEEIVKKDEKSLDKRKGVWYTISKMIRKGG